MPGKRVKATREGLVGDMTSIGWRIDAIIPFVALPSTKALFRAVRVHNPANGRSCVALVLDVGPWNEHDDNYVDGSARPAAELGVDTRGRKTNGAGIDLGEHVWKALGMVDNSDVEWEFL